MFAEGYLSTMPQIVVISATTDTTAQKDSSDGVNPLSKIPDVIEIRYLKIFMIFFKSSKDLS